MALDTSTKRRSSVRLMQPWQPAPPSPTDTPAVIDEADRSHTAWGYSGISALVISGGTRMEWRAAFNVWHRSSS